MIQGLHPVKFTYKAGPRFCTHCSQLSGSEHLPAGAGVKTMLTDGRGSPNKNCKKRKVKLCNDYVMRYINRTWFCEQDVICDIIEGQDAPHLKYYLQVCKSTNQTAWSLISIQDKKW